MVGCLAVTYFTKTENDKNPWKTTGLTLTRSRKASTAPAQERRSSLRHAKGAGLRGFSSFQPLGEKAAQTAVRACVRACVCSFSPNSSVGQIPSNEIKVKGCVDLYF